MVVETHIAIISNKVALKYFNHYEIEIRQKYRMIKMTE